MLVSFPSKGVKNNAIVGKLQETGPDDVRNFAMQI